MNAPVDVARSNVALDARLGIIDCDIHPFPRRVRWTNICRSAGGTIWPNTAR